MAGRGAPGGALFGWVCEPFLGLVASRRLFCNDRGRFPFAQRDRRRRVSATAHDPEIDEEIERIEQEIDERARTERAIKADLASSEPWLPEKTAKKLRRRKRHQSPVAGVDES